MSECLMVLIILTAGPDGVSVELIRQFVDNYRPAIYSVDARHDR